ncbi:O-antigen ligase family protein [Balneatrix alpica]|uniref:O-antigen ligase family protein n=1 Tax=Balneatrix alpica TaxID=75684 RepID=A0ABV5ZB24_9GAMM|nr:O-antigen ligase family protein [Balneatrix alpica]
MSTPTSLAPRWIQAVLGLFLLLYFLPIPTRFKELSSILLLLSTLVWLWPLRQQGLLLIRQPLAWGLALLLGTLGYAIAISPDPGQSWAEAKNLYGIKITLTAFCLAWLLQHPQLQPEACARWLLACLAGSALLLNGFNLWQYWQEYQLLGGAPEDIWAHRPYSDAMVLLLPFMLMAWWHASTRSSQLIWIGLLTLHGILLLGTGARSAWLAVAFIGLAWLLLHLNRRLLFASALVALAGLLLAFALLPDYLLDRLTQTSSSGRTGGGTWSSAWELIQQAPWQGHGFGAFLYDQIYNAAAPLHPHWLFTESMGPHNLWLTHWFYGGLPFLLATMTFCAILLYCNGQACRGLPQQSWQRSLLLAISLSLFGGFIVRGQFETPELQFWGVLLGLSWGLLNRQPAASK